LRYYEHRSDEEIATELGISRGTVRSQAARGLDKLRARWAPARLSETKGSRGPVGVLDANSDTFRPLGGGVSAPEYRQPATLVTVTGDRVVSCVYRGGATQHVEIWTARVDTGTPVRVATLSIPHGIDPLVKQRAFAAGDWVFFAIADGPDLTPVLYRVPVSGGTREVAPGGSAFIPESSPWTRSAAGGRGAGPNEEPWRNVLTGEQATPVLVPGQAANTCIPYWCLAGDRLARWDGTDLVRAGRTLLGFAAGGRFVTGDDFVWDPATGATAAVGGPIRPEGHRSPGGGMYNDATVIALTWNSVLAKEHVVLDLTQIG
jgi:hypothetical protein